MNATRRPIPFEPESIQSLRARYSAAISEAIDLEAVVASDDQGPCQLRRCVFDTVDGFRLIIARELFRGREYLHVSASLSQDSQVFAEIRAGLLNPHDFFTISEEWFRRISRDARPLTFVGLSGGCVPHWTRNLTEAPPHWYRILIGGAL